MSSDIDGALELSYSEDNLDIPLSLVNKLP